jgi:FeS assembly SUF system protein
MDEKESYQYPASIKSLPVVNESPKIDQLKHDLRESIQASHENPPAQGHASEPSATIERKLLEGKVIEALRMVYDPEIPINIYDLGLIYEIKVTPQNQVTVKMTLTAPACPVAETLPIEVEKRIENIPEVNSAEVILVWDPPWDKSRMSEAAILELGL